MSASLTSSLSRTTFGTSRAATLNSSSTTSTLSRLATATARSATKTTLRFATATSRATTTTSRRWTYTGYATATATVRPRPAGTGGSIGGFHVSGLMIIPLFVAGFAGTLLLGIALCLAFSRTCRLRLRQSIRQSPFGSTSYPSPPPTTLPAAERRLGPDGFPLAGAALRLSRSLDEAALRRARGGQAPSGGGSSGRGGVLGGVLAAARQSQDRTTADWLLARIGLGGGEGDGEDDVGKPSFFAVELRVAADEKVGQPISTSILGGRTARAMYLVRLPSPSDPPDEAILPELELGVEVLSLEGDYWPPG